MDSIHDQLDTLKRTMAAILDGIERLELQLDPDTATNTAEFNRWADEFDQRWANRKQPCKWGCDGSGQVYVMDDGDGNGHIEPCECRIAAEMTDPSYNGHAAAWR